MRAQITKKTVTSIAAGAAMLITLVGCASAAPDEQAQGGTSSAEASAAPEQGVFEFQTPRYGSDSGELLIRLPEDLLDVVTDREMLATEAVLTPRELGGAKYCAIDVEPRYVDGSQDVLLAPEEGLTGDATPAWGLLRDAKPISELDDSDPERGTYYSDGLSVITLVASCAASPADDGNMEFNFPAKVKKDGQIAWLGTVELSAMKSGTITVTEGRVGGFVRDTDGNWIED